MILPARELLLVEREKVLDYLLDLDHRYGASKARFFGAFGFRRDAWEVLRDALCEHGRRWEVKKMTETGFGPRYEVHGELETADGRRPPAYLYCLAVGRGPDGATAYHCVSGGIMIKEHDCVVLTSDLAGEGLLSGDVGTVVHIHRNVSAYEVEFATLTGKTIAVTTVLPSQCRPIGHRDINHVREVHAA